MNRQGDSLGEAEPGSDSAWQDSTSRSVDVNNDGEISPLDVMLVVNRINFYNPLTPCTCAACVGDSFTDRCQAAVYGQIQNQELLSGKVSSQVLLQGELFGSSSMTRLRLPGDVFDSSFQNEHEESVRPLLQDPAELP